MGTRPEPDQVSQRLKLLRLALGHKRQTEMVAFLGWPITTQHWNNWERGRSVPTIGLSRHVGVKTGVTVDWIYWGDRGGLTLNVAQMLDRAEKGTS